MAKLPNASDLVTLEEAAAYAGYRSVSTLRKAAREGRLRVVQLGPRTILTTHDWVYAYEDRIAGKGGRPRGHQHQVTHSPAHAPHNDDQRKEVRPTPVQGGPRQQG